MPCNVSLVCGISDAVFDYIMINSKRRLKPVIVSIHLLSCGSSSHRGILNRKPKLANLKATNLGF